MSRRAVIILIAVLVLVVVAAITFVVAGNLQGNGGGVGTSTSTPPVTLPPVTPPASTTVGPPPAGNSITMGTADGNVIVNNFYQTAATTSPDGQTVELQDQNNYSIVYNVSDSSFIISILATPLEQSRQEAEAAFLQQLGVSQTDACKLKVSEGVPISVSDQYPGVNFPLSFCGDSTPM